jgi:hypothetical protein
MTTGGSQTSWKIRVARKDNANYYGYFFDGWILLSGLDTVPMFSSSLFCFCGKCIDPQHPCRIGHPRAHSPPPPPSQTSSARLVRTNSSLISNYARAICIQLTAWCMQSYVEMYSTALLTFYLSLSLSLSFSLCLSLSLLSLSSLSSSLSLSSSFYLSRSLSFTLFLYLSLSLSFFLPVCRTCI